MPQGLSTREHAARWGGEVVWTPEEVELVNWLADPEAKRILRSFIYNPPTFERKVAVYALTRDEWLVATGRRAERLAAIRERYGAQTLQHCHAVGDTSAMMAFCGMLPTVEQAITAMLSAPPIVRSVKVARPVERARAA